MDIVLVNPKIPQNTGSIARTCAATGTPLHLVGTLGFDISDKAVKRAGLDYWPHVELHRHSDLNQYLKVRNPGQCWFISKFGSRVYYDAPFKNGDALIFGDEVTGLGPGVLNGLQEEFILRIPMSCKEVRSLNLSNAVSVVLYEARRQLRLD